MVVVAGTVAVDIVVEGKNRPVPLGAVAEEKNHPGVVAGQAGTAGHIDLAADKGS